LRPPPPLPPPPLPPLPSPPPRPPHTHPPARPRPHHLPAPQPPPRRQSSHRRPPRTRTIERDRFRPPTRAAAPQLGWSFGRHYKKHNPKRSRIGLRVNWTYLLDSY